MDELKEKKANERSNRLIIKGRKVMERGFLNKETRKSVRIENEKNETDDKYMLFYDEN